MNTRETIQRIRVEVRDPEEKKAIDDDVYVSAAINPTVREMESDGLIRTRTGIIYTAIGTDLYDVPSTIGTYHWIERVSYGTGKTRLPYVERSEAVALAASGSGTPRYWTMWNDQIELVPAPSAESAPVYVDAYCSPNSATEVSPASDQVSYSADLEDCLVIGGTFRILRIMRQWDNANQYRQDYENRKMAIRTKMNPDGGDIPCAGDASGVDEYYINL